MSVIVELSVDDEEFILGAVLAEPPDMHIELERVVPTGESVVPFLWVAGDDYEPFEARVRESESIESFSALDCLDDRVLYRIEWRDEPHELLYGIKQSDGVVLEAHGNDGWLFRLRFPNHHAVSLFYNYCMEHDIGIHITRSYTLTESTEFGHRFGLSNEQREALVLGLEHGYFDTPSQVSLDELAGELDISQQAMSNRIRLGTKKVLSEALLSASAGPE